MERNLSSHHSLLLCLNDDWRSEAVNLDMDKSKFASVWGSAVRGDLPCYGKTVSRADLAPERTCRHLATM